MATPVVTVGIPVYNGSSIIAAAIESVLNQLFPDFELIIYDDGSTDDTWAICERYAKSDMRVRLIRGKANLGRPAARNRIIDEARGDLLAWLDADDLWRPKKLTLEIGAWRKATAKYPEADVMVVSPYRRRLLGHGSSSIVLPPPELTFEALSAYRDATGYAFQLQASLGPTELYRRIGKFDDRLNWAEDYDLVIRLIQRGARIFGVPYPRELATYNYSISGKSPDLILACQKIVRSKHRAYFRKHGVDIERMYAWRFVRYTIQAFLENNRAGDAIAPLTKLITRYGSNDAELLAEVAIRLRQVATLIGAKQLHTKPATKKPSQNRSARPRS